MKANQASLPGITPRHPALRESRDVCTIKVRWLLQVCGPITGPCQTSDPE